MIKLLYWSIPYIVSKVNNLILQAAKTSKLYRKHQKVGILTVAIVYSVGFTDICCVEEQKRSVRWSVRMVVKSS